MAGLRRVTLLTLIAFAIGSRAAAAAPITVGEFLWEVTLDSTPGCSVDDPTCVLSTFSFTYLWDGPQPGPTLTNNQLTLSTGSLTFFDLDSSFPFDQLAVSGLPLFATIGTSFLFDNELVTLSATLAQPTASSASAVLEFSPAAPVPEPASLTLVGLGLAMVARRARRVARRS